jgi:hypothetical protein
MKSLFAASAATLLAIVTPALAQTNPSTGTTGAGTSTSDVPESMRIEQQATEQYNRNSAGTTATEAAGGVGASPPVERNRLDPAAPSDKRLQIDDGTSAAVRQNPDANAMHPSSAGTTYNTIVRGSPSTNGASTGVSGSGSAGTGTASPGLGSSSMGSSSTGSGSSSGSTSSGGSSH